ncbi:hypothetical protein OBA47_00530 [bacterium]|nr:hypothetical protein [bacterium]
MNGRLLSLLQASNGGDLFGSYGGVFSLQMVCFLGAAFDDALFGFGGVSRNGENPLRRRHGDGGELNLG